MKIYEAIKDDFEKIKEVMEMVDHEFVPLLSRRPEGINGRVSGNLAQEDANYLIAETQGRVVGVLGYRKNWKGTGEAYISFIAVRPEYRRRRIAHSLEAALTQKLSGERIPHVNVTTWSTNPDVCKMYKQLGYLISRTLKDDRGPGVDTIYFRKAIES